MQTPAPEHTPAPTTNHAAAHAQAALGDGDRALCAAQAAWLCAVLQLAPLAWLLQCLGVLACLLDVWHNRHMPWLLWAVVAAAVLERWHALRLALDARLFRQLATGQFVSLAELDTALSRLGLRTSKADAPVRTLAGRMDGCRRLAGRYVACVVVQGLVAVGVFLSYLH
ncbi:MAG: hypothetical protein Q4G39_02160 [Brachymonas sp.]|nr:hypothetical protein [Brachymonas sp.]